LQKINLLDTIEQRGILYRKSTVNQIKIKMPSFRYSSAFFGLALLVVIHRTAADAGN